MSNAFKFFCPVGIKKAKDKDGNEVMRLGGIASTMDEDSDGEFLDPSGFEIKDFKKVGFVNWHHQASDSPATIIGEPHKAELRSEGFYVECDLYPSSELAKEVYDLAQVLKSDSKNRRLGYSIEGSVIERGSDDKTDPAYRIVKRAKITGLAITHMPKNGQTFAEIIKGKIGEPLEKEPNWEEDEKEKSLSTTSGAAITKESVDGNEKNVTTLEKSQYSVVKLNYEEMYDLIFDTFPAITIEKAEKVFNLLTKIDNTMAKGEKIKDDNLEKAMNLLGFDSLDENPFLEKGKKASDMTDEEVASAVGDKVFNKPDGDKETGAAPSTEKGCATDKGDEKDMEKGDDSDSEDDSDKEEKSMKKGKEDSALSKGAVLILKKTIEKAEANQINHTKALGQLVKATMDQNELLKAEVEELKKSNGELQDGLVKANESINKISQNPMGRRSITKGYRKKESFAKSEQDNSTPKNILSKSKQYKQVLDLVDNAAFAKGGYDEEFAKAVTSFEVTKELPSTVVARIKSEYGISIVD